MDRCKISEWEVVLGAPDIVNISCLMHDTHLCQIEMLQHGSLLKLNCHVYCNSLVFCDKDYCQLN